MTRGGKILLWTTGLLLFGLFGLWALGSFSGAGTLIIAKERVLATTGLLPSFETQKSTGGMALPEAKESGDIAKNLLIELVALEKSGNSTPESRSALVNKLYTQAGLNESFSFTPYTLNDLNIVADGKQAKNNYKKGVSGILKNNYYAGLGDEVEVWIKSRELDQREKEKGNLALEKANKSYQKITDTLRVIPVPKELAGAHLKILNIFKSLADTTLIMLKNDDLVSSLTAVQFFYGGLPNN
jgi:hypothetical protein